MLDIAKRFFTGQLGATPYGYAETYRDQSIFPYISGTTRSGITVTEETALSFSAVYACVKIISDTIASLPLHVYSEVRGGRSKAKNLQLYRVLSAQPHPSYTSYTFRHAMTTHLMLYGNAYALIKRDKHMNVVSLTILDPNTVETSIGKNYEIFYKWGKKKILSTDMIHFKINTTNAAKGQSPIGYARENIGLGLAAEAYGQTFFGNGSHVKQVVEVPANTSKDQKSALKNTLQDKYGGVVGKESNGTLVLQNGAKFSNVQIPMDDAQFIQTRKFQLLEIARIFGVPPHKLSELEKSSYSTNEQAELAFVTDTIRPLLVNMEQEYNAKLLKNDEILKYDIEHDIDARLRGDVATRTAYYTGMRSNGAMTADEIREREGMNRLTPKQKEEIQSFKTNYTEYVSAADTNETTDPNINNIDKNNNESNG